MAADRTVWILYLVDKVKFKTIGEADGNLLTLMLSSELIKRVSRRNRCLGPHRRLI